ncbi:hypothetical protein BDK51DRAFT_47472 [Blyttiomyces helicus]|uniref:C2H2-type domain-containing protein n=1 Tax=Blyttiomyces helicus TaxID=388810 RepID=A0A4P9W2D7_9FUNG|nr:hypothetical protein BDK51DRAFT_47472 [Blyttiomyces helicus]|eukprot:RKO85892.1 hypothetical protein BDK51DRAFT_47472 [Blyttiomyces helicus]
MPSDGCSAGTALDHLLLLGEGKGEEPWGQSESSHGQPPTSAVNLFIAISEDDKPHVNARRKLPPVAQVVAARLRLEKRQDLARVDVHGSTRRRDLEACGLSPEVVEREIGTWLQQTADDTLETVEEFPAGFSNVRLYRVTIGDMIKLTAGVDVSHRPRPPSAIRIVETVDGSKVVTKFRTAVGVEGDDRDVIEAVFGMQVAKIKGNMFPKAIAITMLTKLPRSKKMMLKKELRKTPPVEGPAPTCTGEPKSIPRGSASRPLRTLRSSLSSPNYPPIKRASSPLADARARKKRRVEAGGSAGASTARAGEDTDSTATNERRRSLRSAKARASHHDHESPSRSIEDPMDDEAEDSARAGILTCDVGGCPIRFHTIGDFMAHRATLNHCPEEGCSETFYTSASLARHQQQHQSPPGPMGTKWPGVGFEWCETDEEEEDSSADDGESSDDEDTDGDFGGPIDPRWRPLPVESDPSAQSSSSSPIRSSRIEPLPSASLSAVEIYRVPTCSPPSIVPPTHGARLNVLNLPQASGDPSPLVPRRRREPSRPIAGERAFAREVLPKPALGTDRVDPAEGDPVKIEIDEEGVVIDVTNEDVKVEVWE